MPTRAQRKRRTDAEIIFQGQAIGPDLLPSLWREGEQLRQYSRYRQAAARGLRLKTMVIRLKESWVRRHPDAAEWVVKVLPERRTLERDLIASVAAIEPYYDRVATGDLARDGDNAEACASFMETWRKDAVPYQTCAEKFTEDGEGGIIILPSDVDMDGRPDFYDRIDQDAYDALDDEERAEYTPDEDDPKERYSKKNEDGSKKQAYGSNEEHEAAVQRYLLQQEQGAVSVRFIPSGDCIPYLTRGTGRDRWATYAMLERTLYYPDELLQKGYGWRGMGDRLLIPQGFDATRSTGQNGMFYLYTLYMVWIDPKDKKRIPRPIVAYSVSGQPTWTGDVPADQELPDSGVAVLDLYESHGLTGPFWKYGGGLHTSDDNSDFYWEPYIWAFFETIFGIEGLSTMGAAATAVQAVTGYYHKPDAALLAMEDESLIDAATGTLRVPEIPDAGEIKTIIGDIVPATPAQASPDLWRVIAQEMQSLRENTMLEQPGGLGSQPSGRSMVVKETIAQTAKRQIRESAKDFVQFCGERALRIFDAIATEFDVRWPLQTTEERPVGSEMRLAAVPLTFDPDWVKGGEYRLTCEYPKEENPVRVEQAVSKYERGVGSFEEICEASGITDVESEWAKVLKSKIRNHPAYVEAQVTRLAKRQGNRLMLQVLNLQQQQRMTKAGPPGFEQGVPTAALNGPGDQQPSGGIGGGPTTAQRSLGGTMAAETGPQQQDAQAAMMAGQGAA